jgi:hypothetical protein
MKTFGCVAAIVLLSMACVAQAAPVELSVNGDFDTDLSGWVNLGTWATWTSNTPDGGGMAIAGGPYEPYMDNTAGFLTAGTYKLEFDAVSPDASAAAAGLVARIWTNGATALGSDSGYTCTYAEPLNAGWAHYSFTYTISGHDSDWAEVTIDSPAEGGNYIVDNVSLHQVVPEPGTVVLLITGLIGLLCYAWRKCK